MHLVKLLLLHIPLTALLTSTALLARAVRCGRRVTGKMPRIMHGPQPMVGLGYRASADRRFGHQSDVVVNNPGTWGYRYLEPSEFDHIIETSPRNLLRQRIKGFLRVMFGYDIVVTFFNGSFFSVGLLRIAEFRLLKLAGLKIVTVSYGADVIQYDAPAPRFDWINQLRKDYPPRADHCESTHTAATHDQFVRANIRRKGRVSNMLIASGHPLATMHPHDLNFRYFPIDCDEWQPLFETGNQVPVIVHAPNHRHVKGTDLLIEACDRLREAGYLFELRLVEGVPRDQVMEIYRKADILVEELLMGQGGLNGMEFLALGKTVATCLNQDQLLDPVFDEPIININPENVDEVLKVIVSIPALRLRLGLAGRATSEQYLSYQATGQVWDRIYRHLWFGDEMDLQTTSIFSPTRCPRGLTENPRDENFWPVPVGDIIDDIRAAVAVPPVTPATNESAHES